MPKKSTKTKIYDYCYSLHYGLCHGVVDSINAIMVKDRVIWSGRMAQNGTLDIAKDSLWGGDLKEGGVNGLIDVRLGTSNQKMSDAAAARVGLTGDTMPGYRGIAHIFFRGRTNTSGFKWATNNPYLPAPSFNLTRIPKALDASTAVIPNLEAGVTDEGRDDGWLAVTGTAAPTLITAVWNNDSPQDRIYTADFPDWQRVGGSPANGWTGAGSGFRVSRTTTAISGGVYRDLSLADLGLTEAEVDAGEVELRFFGDCSQVGTEFTASTSFTISLRQLNVDGYGYATGIWVAKPVGAIDGVADTVNATRIGAYLPVDPGTRTIRLGVEIAGPAEEVNLPNQYSQILGLSVYRSGLAEGADANPAHMIYECLTEGEWALGESLAVVNQTSFQEAAQTLYDEGFGLSMLWTKQSAVRNFVQEVQDHIQASVFVRPSTGKWEIKLFRGGVVPVDLRILTPNNSRVIEGSRRLWGEVIGEVNIGFTDAVTDKERTITFQDPAVIQMQGGKPTSTKRDYYGIRKSTLAVAVGARDIREAAYPLWVGKIETHRSFWDVVPGDILGFESPEDGIEFMLLRVQKMHYGKPGSRKIQMDVTEDIFGLDYGEFEEVPGTDWVPPTVTPVNFDYVNLYTLPLPLVLRSGIALSEISDDDYPRVVVGIMADANVRSAIDYQLYAPVLASNGDTILDVIATQAPIRSGLLPVAWVPAATTTISEVALLPLTGGLEPTGGDFFKLGYGDVDDEIVMLYSFNAGTGIWTVARGMFDTVPRDWAAGSRIWYMGGDGGEFDDSDRASGAAVTYRLAPSTGGRQMDVDEATPHTITPTDRPYQPNRPANVQIDGNGFGPTVYDSPMPPSSVTVTWANRNRLSEDTVAPRWTDATTTPEAGQTTTIRLRALDGTVITTIPSLTGTSYVLAATALAGNVYCFVEVYSERDGFESKALSSRFLQIGASGYGLRYGFDYGGFTA